MGHWDWGKPFANTFWVVSTQLTTFANHGTTTQCDIFDGRCWSNNIISIF